MPGNKLSKPAEGAKPVGKNLPKRQAPWNDAEISPQNRDVLLQIASLIRLAESFRLGFVKCNQPIQSRLMTARLKELLGDEAIIIIVELTEPVVSLRRAVLQALELDKQDILGKRAILVLGFERTIPSEGPAPALDELNQSRENFPKSFSGPVLIWLPDYALTRLAREAPDFWGWRSGVFEFSPELKIVAAVENMLGNSFSDSLSLSEKIEKASALEGLIRDYQELPREERTDRSLASVLRSLGNTRYYLGEYNEAYRLYQESMKISEELGDKSGVSKSLGQLGILAHAMGDLGEARRLYQESMKISEELGDKSDVSASLHQLGNLAYVTGDLGEARRLYQEGLKIAQDLGDKSGVSRSLHQLGNLAYVTGDLAEARRLYQESMKIAQKIGDRYAPSKSLHQLGMLAHASGNLAEARSLYQESMKISQELGDKSSVFKLLHQLGMIAHASGNLAEARRLYHESLNISQELGEKNGIASTLARLSLLEVDEGYMDKALELIRQAESVFVELGSPEAAQAKTDRQRLEKKIGNP